MLKNKFFSKKILTMMIRENIENNKRLFLKDDSETELIFAEEDYDEISKILEKGLEGKSNISLEDINESIDEFLVSKGYIFDGNLENKYKKTIDGNYYYFGIVELGYYSAETSMDKLVFRLSEIIDKNYEKLRKSTKVSNNLVNINIVKDNSSRFNSDKNKAVFQTGFNLVTRNLIFNFNLDEIFKIHKN